MTNNLGHLPKIDDLDDVNIKRLETWYAKAYQDDNDENRRTKRKFAILAVLL